MAGSRYLKQFNAISALLWTFVLIRMVILYYVTGPEFVSEGLSEFLAWVQTLAVLEVVHPLLGLVKASLLTAVMQVASRLIIIWGVVRMFPDSSDNVVFCTMVLAWSIAEMIRYPFYWFNLNGSVPELLHTLRYNLFIVLYPLGAFSEMYLAWCAIPYAQAWNPYYTLFLKAVLLVWPPSLYILFTHMWKQRRQFYKKKALATRKTK